MSAFLPLRVILPVAYCCAFTAQAQELVPGNFDSAQSHLYPRPVAEQYRQQRVRAVLVQYQRSTNEARPVALSSVSYQEFDAEGRVISQYWTGGGRIAQRLDYTYAGQEAATFTTLNRLEDPTDTTRLGRVWLPTAHTSYPALPGTGSMAVWDSQTGDWQVYNRLRRWQSHDTTYVATTSARTGALSTLERTYFVGAGQKLQRKDNLGYGPAGQLREAAYTYLRFDQKRLLEIGRVDFQQAVLDYLTSHPEHTKVQPTLSSLQGRDAMVRHLAGQLHPQATQTYDARGLVRSRTAVGNRIDYTRNARGQLQQTQHFRYDQLWQLTRFSYQPNGLLARASTFTKEGKPAGVYVYRYWYFEPKK